MRARSPETEIRYLRRTLRTPRARSTPSPAFSRCPPASPAPSLSGTCALGRHQPPRRRGRRSLAGPTARAPAGPPRPRPPQRSGASRCRGRTSRARDLSTASLPGLGSARRSSSRRRTRCSGRPASVRLPKRSGRIGTGSSTSGLRISSRRGAEGRCRATGSATPVRRASRMRRRVKAR
jgi:hypothetical protein